MKLFKNTDRRTILYWSLIITFAVLYIATAFVSWYHAISFFNISNPVWLSVILSFVAEIGQASVLFSILLTQNKNKFLSWFIMILLTTLQVIGNVVSSYKFIETSNSVDFKYFQDSILFFLDGYDGTMFKIIIAWITGALLPIIALGMTSLVSQNIRLKDQEEEDDNYVEEDEKEPIDEEDEENPINEEDIDINDQEDVEIENEIISDPEIIKESKEEIESNIDEEYIDIQEIQNIEQPEKNESVVEKIEDDKNILKVDFKPEEVLKEDELPPIEENKKEKPIKIKNPKKPKEKKTKVSKIKIKEPKISKVKTLKELEKEPTKGDEIIESIKEEHKPEEIIVEPLIKDEPIESNLGDVSVIDVKAIPKNPKVKVDKFGIPINPGENNNFDTI